MEDYPQPVTGLIKDKSTEKKGIGIPEEVYNDDQSKGATDITDKRVNERQTAEDKLQASGNYRQKTSWGCIDIQPMIRGTNH